MDGLLVLKRACAGARDFIRRLTEAWSRIAADEARVMFQASVPIVMRFVIVAIIAALSVIVVCIIAFILGPRALCDSTHP
eukprot:469248-Rhodomonas_salina.2